MNPLGKILLVRTNPNRPRTAACPPLGCLYLAGAVRSWLDDKIEIRLADMRAAPLSQTRLASLYREFAPDVVGFSSLSCEHDALLEAARRCKAWNPRCLTVVGGPHASMFGDLLVGCPDIDVVVRGEGERTFVELLAAWAEGRGFHDIPGLVFREGDRSIETPPRPLEANLDRLPAPAWDLLHIAAYTRHTNMNGMLAASPYLPVMTSRGCPFGCKYCHRLFGRRFRQRSSEKVLDELEELYHRFGVREIHFVDDCFNLKPERAKAIADGMVARGLKVKIAFPNGLRADLMDEELIAKLKAAGAYMITYAVETASPRLQRLIGKNLRLKRTAEIIEATWRLGVIPAGFFMLGFPTETRAEMEETIRFACRSSMLKAYFFNVVPFPRTELFELVERTYPDLPRPANISGSYFYWAEDPYFTRATGIDLEAVQRSAYRRFYFDGRRLLRIMTHFPKNRHLLWGLFYGLQASFSPVEAFNRLRLSLLSR